MVFDGKEWLKALDPDQNSAINDIVAKHKSEWESKVKEAEAQMALIREERDKYSKVLEDEKKSKMTDEEKRASEIASIREQLNTIKSERDKLFQERQDEKVVSELTKAASKYNPRNLDHVVKLLRPMIEDTNGNLTVAGKSIEDTVKSMKDSEQTSYLFQSEPIKGTGITPVQSSGYVKSSLDSEIEALLPKK